jgi:hypothetical protein
MKKETFDQILKEHNEWLKDHEKGKRADLHEADLREADLRGADLRKADLCEADLREAVLCEAVLRGANLREADLREADLRKADLREADLRGADLRGANLREADLREADLDFSSWPLWCGSISVKVDKKIIAQLAYHLAILSDCPKEIKEALQKTANSFHRVISGEVPEVK